MDPALLHHLRHNWPLTLIVLGLSIYLPITLIKGEFYTNQGRILKPAEPGRYWKWVLAFAALEVLCLAVLVGSFFLSRR